MKTDPAVLTAWARRVHELADPELFEILANMITCLIADLTTATTDAEIEFHWMLVTLRDEALERHHTGEHHSSEPRGNG